MLSSDPRWKWSNDVISLTSHFMISHVPLRSKERLKASIAVGIRAIFLMYVLSPRFIESPGFVRNRWLTLKMSNTHSLSNDHSEYDFISLIKFTQNIIILIAAMVWSMGSKSLWYRESVSNSELNKESIYQIRKATFVVAKADWIECS